MKELRFMYYTHSFKDAFKSVDGRKVKETISDTEVVTPSGKYKEQEWIDLLLNQAKQLCELDIIDKLKEYSLKTCAWINKEEDAYTHALEMYSMKMYKNKDWVGYDEFQFMLNPIMENIEVEQISLF